MAGAKLGKDSLHAGNTPLLYASTLRPRPKEFEVRCECLSIVSTSLWRMTSEEGLTCDLEVR